MSDPIVYQPAGNETILLVDDDPAVLHLTSAILRAAGYHVLMADGGRPAIGMWESANPPVDLLLTDVIMPDLNGPVLAARLRAQQPNLKVLFISGFHDTQFVQRSVDRDFALLAKPFSSQSLLRAVRNSLGEFQPLARGGAST